MGASSFELGFRNTAAATFTIALLACGPSLSDDDGDGGAGNVDADTTCQGADCLNYCPGGTMTTVSGVVRMPNGIDPVPGAVVYVPREVTEFPGVVQCEVCSQLTDISLVSTTTNYDGSFTLGPIPTATDQQPGFTTTLVAQKGRFRKLAEVTINTPCGDNNVTASAVFDLPGSNSGYNNIPNIAVATGDYDVMECVLLKLGLEQGSFDLYSGIFLGNSSGTEGTFDTLLNDLTKMKTYNIIFINCANDTYETLLSDATVRGNIQDYVMSGGRLYVTDWSYDYIEQVEPFAPIIDFGPDATSPATTPEEINAATVGTGGITTEALVLDGGLRLWLETVETVTGSEIIDAEGRVHIEHFLGGWVMQYEVPSDDNVTVWLEGDVTGTGLNGVLPLTTTFDYAQCGRVLYSSYHTAGRDDFGDTAFPAYCSSDELSPQERVLEYLILHIADCINIG